MVFEKMLTMQGMMFLYVIVGFIVRKRGIVGTTALLSSKYHGDERYATGMIFLSTLSSLVTLPLWCLLLG